MAPPQVPFGAAMRRAHFTSFAAGYTPLNHGSYGAHPASVRAAHLAARDEAEGAPDPFIALGFEGRLARQRALAASLLRAPSADDLVFAPNATTAIDTVLKNLRWRPGDVVLCYDAVYPAVALALAWLCEYHRGAVRVEVVGDVAFPLPDDALVDAMVGAARRINGNGSGSGGGGGSGDGNEKGGERVRLAIVDTIISMPGIRVPFERLVPALQAEGALVLVDGAHGAGQVDIDLAALRPDFLVTNLHKWLFVPRGCAALYVPARHQHLIRTTLPTSFGFQRLDPAVPDRPRRFVEIFDFTGESAAPSRPRDGHRSVRQYGGEGWWDGGEEELPTPISSAPTGPDQTVMEMLTDGSQGQTTLRTGFALRVC